MSGIEDAADLVRSSQAQWIEQRDRDCALVVMTSPRTYDASIELACLSEAAMDRTLFLRQLQGASWTQR